MPATAVTEPPADAPRDYSVAEAAAALGMSRRWLSAQAATRQVPHYRHGNRFLFSAAHLAEIREMSEVRPQPQSQPQSLPATCDRRRRAG